MRIADFLPSSFINWLCHENYAFLNSDDDNRRSSQSFYTQAEEEGRASCWMESDMKTGAGICPILP
jgi:hypothetical protein